MPNLVRFRSTAQIIAAALLLVASSGALAMSQPPQSLNSEIVLTNSTLETLQVSLQGTANAELLSAEVPPLATRTLARLTRDAATDSSLVLNLSSDADQFILQQNTAGLNVSFTASGNGWNLAGQSDENIHRQAANIEGRAATLAVKGESLNDGGVIRYVLQELDNKPVAAAPGDFSLLSYNIWATTIFGSKKVSTRLTQMPEVMAGYDALVLTEVFDLAESNALLDDLRAEYPYQTGDIFKLGKVLGSGTRILSRWPIVLEDSHAYSDCDGIQCAATRGVIYAKLNKQGKTYHLFATHTQSSDDDANRNARLTQLQEMGDYIRSLNLPTDEPVLMAGDFNVNKIGLPQDRDYLEAVLNAREPQNTGHTLSFDSNTNHWAEAPYLEYLDYTLVSNVNQPAVSATQEIIAPRSLQDNLWGEWDLSDHYAARGLFRFDDSTVVRASFPYAGDVVHLQTADGHFLRAMSGGGSFVSAGSSQPGTWESFIPALLANGKVALQARNGGYVGLHSYLLGTLTTGHSKDSAAAQFELVNLGNNRVALKADNGKYLRADFGGGAGASAGSADIGANQTFVLIRP